MIPAWMKCDKPRLLFLAALCVWARGESVQAAGLADGARPRAAEAAGAGPAVSPIFPGGRGQAETYSDETDKPLTTRFADGWFAEENSPTGPFRWMASEGHIEVITKRKGNLVIRIHTRSFVPDNGVEVLVDGKSVESIKLTGVEWQDALVRVPLTAGPHHISFRSRQHGAQPPGDSRTLTVCVENFQATLEP